MGYQWVVRSVSLTDRIIHLVWMHLKNSVLSAWHSPVASIAAGVSAAGTPVSGSVTGAVSGASPVSMSSAGGWSPTGARPPVFTTVGALTAEATAGDWAIVTIPVKDTSWLLFVIPIIAWLGECPAYDTVPWFGWGNALTWRGGRCRLHNADGRLSGVTLWVHHNNLLAWSSWNHNTPPW